jgi:Tol biopolymer transport system component
VAVDQLDPQTGFVDIWLHDLTRGTASRFTFNSKNNASPVWSPDGSHIAFLSTRDGPNNVYQKGTGGMAQDQPLDKSALNKVSVNWSRDGRYIIEMVAAPKTGYDIWVLPQFGDRRPFPYLQTAFNESFAKLSPDGLWLAYASDETKREEIYVQTFPTPGGKWQISTSGGTRPVWSRDGKELFFVGGITPSPSVLGPDQRLMAVDVKGEVLNGAAKFEAGIPKSLFDTHLVNTFDVSKDGRFLMPVQAEQSTNVPMTVVVNWTAGLKK